MAVKTYTKATQISPHFNSSEFKCKCGCGGMKIDDRLINMLEQLFDKCNAKAIYVVSGYRCPTYDKKIGGFAGRHSKGQAADIQVINKNGKKINTKYVSCIAQDLFKEAGIANINKSYTNIHIDSRTGSRWLGNELVSNSTVTKDFYAYYGLSKSDIAKITGDDNKYNVKVTCGSLRIRSGAGTNYKQVGSVKNGEVFTIVEEATGQGANKWGKLKSGAGWIALDFTKKV